MIRSEAGRSGPTQAKRGGPVGSPLTGRHMIVDALLDLIQGVVVFIIRLVPDLTLPSWANPSHVVNGAQTIADLAQPFSWWLPLPFVAGALVSIFLILRGFDVAAIIVRVYSAVRGGGGTGS